MITQEQIRHLFDYKDGQLIWRVSNTNRVQVGDVAGTANSGGYIQIMVNGKSYVAHQMIWVYHNGDMPKGLEIDHINRQRGDNRLDNLRLVTHQENHFNRSKTKGYAWHKVKGKWIASIRVNGKKKHLGYYDNEQDARQSYLSAKQIYHSIQERVA